MKYRYKTIVLQLFLLLGLAATAQTKEQAAVLQVLHMQEQAWNTGNIPLFMTGYWHNDSLAFVGSKDITYGWDCTLERYNKSYPDTAAMGKLKFDIRKIHVLDRENAFVIGRWHLTRSIGDIGGHFTLLFKKFGGRWLIVVDHTS